MKYIIVIIGSILFFACNSNANYPTSGNIILTQGKIDTLTTNIKTVVKDSMKSGIEPMTNYKQDSIYNLEWIQSDSFPKGTVKKVRFNYSGKNIASRIIRRKAEAYLKADLTVLGYKNLIYVDAMQKDSIKNSRRSPE